MFTPVKKFIALATIGAMSLASTAAFAGAFETGSAYYRNNDFTHALQAWQPIATSNPEVQNNIGVMYMDGKGVRRNTTEALRWIARSAANGSSSGQNNLGGLYRDGTGVPRDFGKAFAFFAASAAQGNGGGQLNLGFMYAMGQGTQTDNTRAYMWFDIAAASGIAKAVSNRNMLRQRMSQQQLVMAQQMEQRCRQSNFKACG